MSSLLKRDTALEKHLSVTATYSAKSMLPRRKRPTDREVASLNFSIRDSGSLKARSCPLQTVGLAVICVDKLTLDSQLDRPWSHDPFFHGHPLRNRKRPIAIILSELLWQPVIVDPVVHQKRAIGLMARFKRGLGDDHEHHRVRRPNFAGTLR